MEKKKKLLIIQNKIYINIFQSKNGTKTQGWTKGSMWKMENENPDEKPIWNLKNGEIASHKFNKSNVFDMFNNDIVGVNSYLYPLSILLLPGVGRVGIYPPPNEGYNPLKQQVLSILFKASERSELARRFFGRVFLSFHCNYLSFHCYETLGCFVFKKKITKKSSARWKIYRLNFFIYLFWNIDTILIQVFCLLCLFSLQYHMVIGYFEFIHQILHCFPSPWLAFLLH